MWDGMAGGLVQLTALQPGLPPATVAALDKLRLGITSGRLKPFAAPLVDNAGRERLKQGALSDDQIARMDWLVRGVVGQVPAAR